MTVGHRPTNIKARTFEWRRDIGQPILKHVHSNDGGTKANQYWSTYIRMTVRQRPTNIEARTFEWRWDKDQPILKHVHSNDGETKANQYFEARTFEWRWDKGQPILKHVHSNDSRTKANQYWSTYIQMTVGQRPTNIKARTFECPFEELLLEPVDLEVALLTAGEMGHKVVGHVVHGPTEVLHLLHLKHLGRRHRAQLVPILALTANTTNRPYHTVNSYLDILFVGRAIHEFKITTKCLSHLSNSAYNFKSTNSSVHKHLDRRKNYEISGQWN